MRVKEKLMGTCNESIHYPFEGREGEQQRRRKRISRKQTSGNSGYWEITCHGREI